MKSTEKKLGNNKVWLTVLSVGVVIAIILGIVALVNHGDTKANAIPTISRQVENIENSIPKLEDVSTELKGYIDTLEASVEKLESDITATNTSIDTLETEVYGKVDAEKTATLNQLKGDKAANIASEKAITDQIVALEAKLEKADADNKKALEDSIAALQTTVSDLQDQKADIDTKIDNLKAELNAEIEAVEQTLLTKLNNVKSTIESELSVIKADIEGLKTKDAELDRKIADLQTYVDGKITAIEDWATATFSTLEQYEATQTAISEINALIKNTQDSVTALEEKLNKKISDDIATAVAGVNADIANKVTGITDAYTAAIANAEDAITAAYTDAIKTVITASETSMKDWVNETLADGYYSVAEIDAKLKVLDTKLTDADDDLKKQIQDQQAALEQAKKDLTTAYETAIKEAIETNNGVIDGKIAEAVNTAKTELQSQIEEINEEIEDIKDRLTELETNFANRIQSLIYVPQYSDGKEKMDYITRETSLTFIVSPSSLAQTIKSAFEDDNSTIKAYVRYTDDPTTRAVIGSVEQTVKSVTVSEGVMIRLTIGEQGLSSSFWKGDVEAIIYIQITDDYGNDVISEAIPMLAHGYVANTNSINAFSEGAKLTGELE